MKSMKRKLKRRMERLSLWIKIKGWKMENSITENSISFKNWTTKKFRNLFPVQASGNFKVKQRSSWRNVWEEEEDTVNLLPSSSVIF